MLSALRVVVISVVLIAQGAHAHGGVVADGDLCIINVDYLRGHFKIYQPLIDGHEEYCEDLPNATESVFVMEYLHDGLGKIPVDFRIIHDVTGKGRFAIWDDVAAIQDLEDVTVFYREALVEPDVLTVIHDFEEEGEYIGIVTAMVDSGKTYRAVFPFEVGFTGTGYWPYFVVLALIVQIQYLLMGGRFTRWREKRRAKNAGVSISMSLLVLLAPAAWMNEAAADEVREWTSERGVYTVSFKSSLDPIEINRIHSWVLHVFADGKPITGAAISVSGGMPAHDHGLPTRPRVTEELNQGSYRLDGIRFHMSGEWEVTVEISAGGQSDTAVITLQL